MRLLLVEDDAALGRVLVRGLTEDGHAVDWETNLAGADLAVHVHEYDLCLLDLGLPDGDGATWCRRMRAQGSNLPVLMLTARDTIDEKVSGLDSGADDYLTKPFDYLELAARIRALARRPAAAHAPVLEAFDIRLDPAAHRVWRGPITVPLTAREFALLYELLRRQGEVVTRTHLLEHVWDAMTDPMSNVVDVHIANLRRKLDLPDSPAPIETIRGVGYRIPA